METELFEVKNYSGEGYKPLVSFETWRVAVLRYMDELHPDKLDEMERHTATDEVFILTQGMAMLVLGGNLPDVGEILPVAMNTGEIYNVKQNTWHTIILSQDANIVIVENANTARENSEFASLSTGEIRSVRSLARDFLGVKK